MNFHDVTFMSFFFDCPKLPPGKGFNINYYQFQQFKHVKYN